MTVTQNPGSRFSRRNATLNEAAALHPRLTRRQIYRAIETGKLPAVKIGKNYFVDPAEVEAVLITRVNV